MLSHKRSFQHSGKHSFLCSFQSRHMYKLQVSFLHRFANMPQFLCTLQLSSQQAPTFAPNPPFQHNLVPNPHPRQGSWLHRLCYRRPLDRGMHTRTDRPMHLLLKLLHRLQPRLLHRSTDRHVPCSLCAHHPGCMLLHTKLRLRLHGTALLQPRQGLQHRLWLSFGCRYAYYACF